jgi:hypothetical protein
MPSAVNGQSISVKKSSLFRVVTTGTQVLTPVGRAARFCSGIGHQAAPNHSSGSKVTTQGIQIGTLRLPHPEKTVNVDMVLNTWDFGGQEVYRITHHFFYSKRSIYLLVWRPREGVEDSSIENCLEGVRLRVSQDARVLADLLRWCPPGWYERLVPPLKYGTA